jgi:hypothetical protein
VVDYKNLGSEELGSVYESLLELHPTVNTTNGTFELSVSSGHERKTTGSYYTPTSLINCLLDSALNPVLDEALKKEKSEEALLRLKICDPACGSGHFLIAAAHRMAKRLAALRTGDDEPSPEATRTARRDVIGHCIYGVDVNEMAVELCKVALWMEALEPGKPLSFLDHRIKCGNSLLGATPALLEKGIPDEAFTAIEGDDKKIVSALKKRNRMERAGQMALPLAAETVATYGGFGETVEYMDSIDDTSASGIHEKQEQYERLSASKEYREAWTMADAWCASFVWKKAKDALPAITQAAFRQMQQTPEKKSTEVRLEISRLSRQYNFFHWHLAFPDVFRIPENPESADNADAGWDGGFNVVLGNPPWERIKLQEKEWFASQRPDIANAPNAAARRKLIKRLAEEDPDLYKLFLEDCRQAEGESHLVRDSGRYPLCGCGDINTYAIFAETNRSLIGSPGRAGFIIQSDIATGDTYKDFFSNLLSESRLISFYDFVNTEGIFPAVHRTHPHFCLITLSGSEYSSDADFSFWNTNVHHLGESERHFTMSATDFSLLNPNTRTCPIFRKRRDADITKSIYHHVPVLVKESVPQENPWKIQIRRVFDMNKSDVLLQCIQREPEDGNLNWSAILEAKMIHQYNHRFSSYRNNDVINLSDTNHADANFITKPRFWIPNKEVKEKLTLWSHQWLLVWRDITNTTNERTVIASIVPFAGTDFTLRVALPSYEPVLTLSALLANFNTFIFDYCARQSIGGTHLSDYITKQLPVLPPGKYDASCQWDKTKPTFIYWLLPHILELVYTSWDLEHFAIDCGYKNPPIQWNEDRRFLIRCELDAAFFHLYGISRDDVDYIMETFPIVKRKDEDKYGEYRTKRIILEIYDAMAEAIRTGKPYQTLLDPPPADPSLAHPEKEL